jgi:hypothetical protein
MPTRSIFAGALLAASASAGTLPHERTWMDSAKPVDQRVTELMAVLSLEEKIAQTLHVWTTFHDKQIIETYGKTGVGAMYTQTLSEDPSCNRDLNCRLKARNALQASIINSSAHGIPISFVTESLHNAYVDVDGTRKSFYEGYGAAAGANSTCAEEIRAVCGGTDDPSKTCSACIAAHAPASFPSCNGQCTDVVPGAVAHCDAICTGDVGGVLACIFPMPANQVGEECGG